MSAWQRLRWMDQARGIAIICVLLQHSVSVPARLGLHTPEALAFFNEALQPYRQPLLMFLSGMLLSHSLRKPWRDYASGKVRRILWPMLVWSIPVIILRPPVDITGVLAPAHLWYLLVLLECYLIGPLTRRIRPGVLAGTMLLLQLILPFDSPTVIQYTGPFLTYGAFFMAGSAAMPHLDRWQAVRWPLGIGAGAAGIVVQVAAVQFGWNSNIVTFVAGALGVAAIVWLAPRLPINRLIEAIGRQSMIWYVAHVPVMIVTGMVLWRIDASMSGWVVVMAGLGATTIGCWVLQRLRAAKVLFEFPTRQPSNL